MFNRSFLANLISKPIGVTTKKNIIAIIIGETILPNNIPNLNQILLKGVRNLELNKPKTRNMNAIIKDHILSSSLFISG